MILALLLGCTGAAPEADDTAPAACAVTWETWTEDFMTTYCDACHSARAVDRHGAPEAVTFDTEAETVAQIARVRARVLVDQTMPSGGGVFPDDLVLFAEWVECMDPGGGE